MTKSQEFLERRNKAEDELIQIRIEALVLLPTKIDELAQSYKEYCERQKIEYNFEERAINLLTPLIHIDNSDEMFRERNINITSLWTDSSLEVEVDAIEDNGPVSIGEVSTTNILLMMSDLEVMIANPYKVTFYGGDK